MNNIAIYGAGNYGRTVIKMLKRTKNKEMSIVLVCDSDKRKWETDFEGYTVCPPHKLFEEENLDAVFIAISADNDIDKFILSKKQIRIYKNIEELVARKIFWDISGRCNAKCRYCVTGRDNRYGNFDHIRDSYMDLKTFKKNYRHLYEKGIISKESSLNLYNWKESFLNPDIMDILSYCSQEGQKYGLSTNGSVVRLATDKNIYSKCERIIFSMPGFSQESYDRIHGFVFDVIKGNIIKIKNDMIENGFKGDFVISAHIYRFSEREMESLTKWAEAEGLRVNAYYPYLAGNSLVEDFFEGRLDVTSKNDILEDLFIQWESGVDQRMKDFINPLCNQLTIDEKGNLTLCCAADEFCESFYGWGTVEDLDSYDDYLKLKEKMLESKTCMQCRKYAIAYKYLHNDRVI